MSKRTGEAARRALALVALVGVSLFSEPARAEPEVRFEARVDRQTLSMDESLTLTVRLSVSGGKARDLELPAAPDFEILSRGKSDQSAFQLGPGGLVRSRTETHTLVLRPLREGMSTIQPGKVLVDGTRYETEAIYVRVTEGRGAAPAPTEPRVASGPARGEVFVEVQLDKERAYVGEEILLSIWLYSRVDIANVTSVNLPDLDGFWIGEIANPTQLSARMQEVNGVPYRVYLLSRKALFGLREGELAIEPAEVELTVGGRPFRRGRSLRRTSRPAKIELLPLPPGEEGRPVGGVGSFRLLGTASPQRARVGEPITYRVTVAGQGNLSSIDFPRLPEIEGLRAFEPTVSETVDVSGGRYGGSKTREIVLIPERAGRFEIPSLPWVYFDPTTERYERLETEAFSIEVRGARDATAAVPEAASPLPLRDPPRLIAPSAPWRAPWFGSALALPGLALLAALALPRLRGRKAARRDAAREALRALSNHEEEAAWPEAIPRILHGYLSARFGLETAGLAHRELAARLEAAGAPPAAIEALTGLLNTCDRERFAPVALRGGRAGAWEEARRLVEALERGRRER